MSLRERRPASDSPKLAELITCGTVRKAEFCDTVGGNELIATVMRALQARGVECACFSAVDADSYRRLNRASRWRMRLILYVLFPARLFLHCLFSRPDVRIVSTNPFYAPWLAALAAPRRVRQINWMLDLFPQALVATGHVAKGSASYNLLNWLSRSMVRRAAASVYLGTRLRDSGVELFGEAAKSHVIPIGSGLDPASLPPAKSADGSNPLRFCYSGNFALLHDTETLAEALLLLAGRTLSRPVEFVFAGTGQGYSPLRARLETVRSPALSVRFLPTLPEPEWKELLGHCAIALVTMKPGAGSVSFPSKTFSCLAAGQAVLAIAPRDSDLAELILGQDCGWLVEPGDASAVARLVEALCADPTQIEPKRKRARSAAEGEFSRSRLAERWLELPLACA